MGGQRKYPLVSVIMPAYNAERFICEAISSVISQTIQDWELIIVDDCSEDATLSIAQKKAAGEPRICVVQNSKNIGVAETRNRGIDHATGQYIAFLDSDDIWHPEKLERQLQKIEATGARICYCSYEIVDELGKKTKADYIVPEKAGFSDILKENYMQCSAMLIRADIVKQFYFNKNFYHEDYILGLDMLRGGETAVGCRELLLSWRYLKNSRSFDKKKSAANRWKIYRNYLHLPLYKACFLFLNYAAAGFMKYFRSM